MWLNLSETTDIKKASIVLVTLVKRPWHGLTVTVRTFETAHVFSPGRKAGLYDLAKKKGVSIGDMNTQLEYLATELAQSYASVLKYIKAVPNTAQGAYDAAYK